eukprot:374118-Amphidinium_carterae.1
MWNGTEHSTKLKHAKDWKSWSKLENSERPTTPQHAWLESGAHSLDEMEESSFYIFLHHGALAYAIASGRCPVPQDPSQSIGYATTKIMQSFQGS